LNREEAQDKIPTTKTQVVKLFEHEDIWAVHQAEGEGPGPYRWAPKVKEAAQEVINQHHSHLKEAQIAFLFRTGSWSSKGKTVTGRASIAPALWRFISGYDLVLILNEMIWFNLTRKGRKALLDHHLSHFAEPSEDKEGNLCWDTREQDIKEFSQVIKRHGICINSGQGLQELAGQMTLETLQDNVEEEVSLGGDFFEEDLLDDEDSHDDGEMFMEEPEEDASTRFNEPEIKKSFSFKPS